MLKMSELMKLWRRFGGSQHGPKVETVTMPYDQFAPFMEAAFDRRHELEHLPEAAEAHRQAMIAAARDCHATDDVNIDDDARLSEADDGCWVQAWVWVPHDEPETGEAEHG